MKSPSEEREILAPFVVHWPSGPTAACREHADKLVALGNHLGNHIPVTHNEDPDAQCANCINEAKKDETNGM